MCHRVVNLICLDQTVLTVESVGQTVASNDSAILRHEV
jgi:hypothetical protein